MTSALHFNFFDFIETIFFSRNLFSYLDSNEQVHTRTCTTTLGARKKYSEIYWTWAYQNRNIRDRFEGSGTEKNRENKHANETTKHTVHQNGLKQYEHDVKLQQR